MSYSDQPVEIRVRSNAAVPLGDSSNSNGPPRAVEPKPFLRRNTGLQKRLLDSRVNKYVPRGGFITDSHEVGDVVSLGARGGKVANGGRGRQRANSKAPPAKIPVMSAKVQGRPRSASTRIEPAESLLAEPQLPRLPAKRDFARPASSSRIVEPPTSALANPKGTTAKRKLPPIRSRALDTERGYAAAARDHRHSNDGTAATPADDFASDEEPQQLRRALPTQNTWQGDDLSEDFEALEQQAAHETAARATATATPRVAATSSRPSSRRNSGTQWEEASGLVERDTGEQEECSSPGGFDTGEGRLKGLRDCQDDAEAEDWAARPEHQQQHSDGNQTARNARGLALEVHSAARSEHSIAALEQLAQPSPLRPPSPSRRRRFLRHEDDDDEDDPQSHTHRSRQRAGGENGYPRDCHPHDSYANGHDEDEAWQSDGDRRGGSAVQRRGPGARIDAAARASATLAHVQRLQPMAPGATLRSRAGALLPRATPEPIDAEVVLLREEVSRLRAEKGRVKALKGQLERSAAFLQEQRASFLKTQEDEKAKWDAERAAAAAKLRRDKLALEKQSRQLLKLPTKKDRSELEAVEALLEHERGEGRAREQRHKLTVERLRRQISDLQEKQTDLKAELTWHVEQRQKLREAPLATAATQEGKDGGRRSRPSSPGRTSQGAERGTHSPPRGFHVREAVPGDRPPRSAATEAPVGSQGLRHSREEDPLFEDDIHSGAASSPMGRGGPPLIHRHSHSGQPIPSYPAATHDGVGHLRWEESSSLSAAAGRSSVAGYPPGHSLHSAAAQRFERLPAPQPGGSTMDQGPRQLSSGMFHATASVEARAPPHSRAAEGPYSSTSATAATLRREPPSIPAMGLDDDYSDRVHMDGKRERLFRDGRRMVVFVNGTIREEYPSGLSLVRFTNGDIKKAYKSGLEEYLFAEVNTWQTICSDGTQVFHFESGQAEAHRPDGSKEVLFADGTGRKMAADGSEQEVHVAQLCPAVRAPPPSDVPAIAL